MGATVAPVTVARSAGDSSTCRPRRPAETKTVARFMAVASSTTGSDLREPIGLMPPHDIPRRALCREGRRELRSASLARLDEALEVELARNGHDRKDEGAVNRRNKRLEHPARIDAQRRGRVLTERRPQIACSAVTFGRRILVHAVGNAGRLEALEGGGAGGAHHPIVRKPVCSGRPASGPRSPVAPACARDGTRRSQFDLRFTRPVG